MRISPGGALGRGAGLLAMTGGKLQLRQRNQLLGEIAGILRLLVARDPLFQHRAGPIQAAVVILRSASPIVASENPSGLTAFRLA